MGASIVTGWNAAPIFQPAKHIFDFVALTVKHLMCHAGHLRFFFGGMQGSIFAAEGVAEPVGVIAAVSLSNLAFGRP